MINTIDGLTKDEENTLIKSLLKGASLRSYTPVNYLKNLASLFDINFVTYTEMLYLVFLDVNGSVKSSIKFRPEFLKFLFESKYRYIASKIKNKNQYIIIDRDNKYSPITLLK